MKARDGHGKQCEIDSRALAKRYGIDEFTNFSPQRQNEIKVTVCQFNRAEDTLDQALNRLSGHVLTHSGEFLHLAEMCFAPWLTADLVPRRSVLLFFSILATVLCVLITFSLGEFRIAGIPHVYMLSFLFGFATFPIYSLYAAHASDFV